MVPSELVASHLAGLPTPQQLWWLSSWLSALWHNSWSVPLRFIRRSPFDMDVATYTGIMASLMDEPQSFLDLTPTMKPPPGTKFNITFLAKFALQNYLKTTVDSVTEVNTVSQESSHTIAVTCFAASMTNVDRTTIPKPDDSCKGTAYRPANRVRWIWIALPAILFLVSQIVLMGAMLQTKRSSMQGWKGIPFALFFVNADGNPHKRLDGQASAYKGYRRRWERRNLTRQERTRGMCRQEGILSSSKRITSWILWSFAVTPLRLSPAPIHELPLREWTSNMVVTDESYPSKPLQPLNSYFWPGVELPPLFAWWYNISRLKSSFFIKIRLKSYHNLKSSIQLFSSVIPYSTEPEQANDGRIDCNSPASSFHPVLPSSHPQVVHHELLKFTNVTPRVLLKCSVEQLIHWMSLVVWFKNLVYSANVDL